MKLKKFDCVEVSWLDITTSSCWDSLQEVEKARPTTVKDVGYFIRQDDEVFLICHSITEDGDCGYTVFPKSVIVKVEKWQRKKK